MTLIDILKAIGISSVVTIIISFVFNIVEKKLSYRFEKVIIERENRYRSILVFMSVLVDFENFKHINTEYRPQASDEETVIKYYLGEIKLHKNFCYLFASQKVIDSIETFINNPTKEKYKETALAMRKDLWNIKL